MFIVAPSRCGSPGKSGHGQWIRSCIWELCSRFSSSFARRISKTAKNVNNRSFVRADNFFFIRMQWMDFSPNDRKISIHSSYKKNSYEMFLRRTAYIIIFTNNELRIYYYFTNLHDNNYVFLKRNAISVSNSLAKSHDLLFRHIHNSPRLVIK